MSNSRFLNTSSPKIIYEDEHLLVVNKPAGLAVYNPAGISPIKSNSVESPPTSLVEFVLSAGYTLSELGEIERPGIVHRLDKNTSGLLVMAKTDSAHTALQAQFLKRAVQRRYTAFSIGNPAQMGTIDLPLGRNPKLRTRQTVLKQGGRRAVTHWTVLQRNPPFVGLSLKLDTGRMHQIRVHLAHSNMPIVGDPIYGLKRHLNTDVDPILGSIIDNFLRQALHATELGFNHPHSGESLHFRSELPQDMKVLEQHLFGGNSSVA